MQEREPLNFFIQFVSSLIGVEFPLSGSYTGPFVYPDKFS